jgi:hypothetical protein
MQIWENLEGLAIEDFGIFYVVYFTTIWNIMWPFGYGYLVYNFPFWYAVPRKIWQPWPIVIKLWMSEILKPFCSFFFPSANRVDLK